MCKKEDAYHGERYGRVLKTGDVITMRLDMDALRLSYSINGTQQRFENEKLGDGLSIETGEYKVMIGMWTKSNILKLLD